jgi:glycerophosphoryl diester phosphodiesterase
VLQVLKTYGYADQAAPVFLQSFDYVELVRVYDELLPALGMNVPLVQLIAENTWLETFARSADGTWQPYDYAWMHTPEGMRTLSRIVKGIGPALNMLVSADSRPGALNLTPLATDAHAAGLQVHAYTFRSDPGQLPAYAASFEQLLDIFCFTVGIDGVFTDFPDQAVRFLEDRR